MTRPTRKKFDHDLIKVLVVDDNDRSFEEIESSLGSASDIQIIGHVEEEREIIEQLQHTQPQVVLLSVAVLCVSSLGVLVKGMQAMSPQAKIIVLHEVGQEHLVLEALRNGVMGHLLRENAHPNEIVTAVRSVNRGEVVLNPDVAGSILDEIVREQQSKSSGEK